jgi:hypothetical protein
MKEVFEEINVSVNEISDVDFADYTLFMVKNSITNGTEAKLKFPMK